ncbi:GAP family protein [Streptomyces sp. NPDC058405]|uniref:GAP family protein n=1 Tax=unclassified Streptomyces TaxID=2593676 RepID=UPI00365B03F7
MSSATSWRKQSSGGRSEGQAGHGGAIGTGLHDRPDGSATTSIVEAGAHNGDLTVAVIVFVLVGSCIVLGAVIIHLFGGQRAASFLDSVRQFMITISTVITAIVLLLLGASILGNGLTGLGR